MKWGPTQSNYLWSHAHKAMSDVDRAHSRELSAIGRIADNVKESIKLRLGSRRAVKCTIVLSEGGYDGRLEGANCARCVCAVESRGDSLTAVLQRSVVAVDCQRAAAAALPPDQCAAK